MMERNILAISGGGFSEEDNAYIDEYLLKIARKQEPLKIAFIATASSDAQGYIDKFYEAFKTEFPSHITMKDFELPNIQEVVNALDIVYVGGGTTQYMLEIWQRSGFDIVLRNAYQNGVILSGINAGAMCWFETCYSEKNKEIYEEYIGLGMLKGSLCPHYNDTERRIAFNRWATPQKNSTLYTLEDNENLHFKNEMLVAKIST
ncbi:Type 1 glutamine amidotransferase-like domain-containing protein [Evansella sp. AB-rgal1]|uniref:Type 1 glutamine amidotransferase-like domain-containing protein n=1 Tax=Evansella sp. AB-rgal1 TaxID=3242696 RepID=UPI00359E66FC